MREYPHKAGSRERGKRHTLHPGLKARCGQRRRRSYGRLPPLMVFSAFIALFTMRSDLEAAAVAAIGAPTGSARPWSGQAACGSFAVVRQAAGLSDLARHQHRMKWRARSRWRPRPGSVVIGSHKNSHHARCRPAWRRR
ncbi:MAG: hypothetical protein MZV49_19565 [Rhodopseudomonas palustris]|nr:hypothetical protein [Rhodopseudomonas palustris]